jgi:long-chain acyl-CoA synthetase
VVPLNVLLRAPEIAYHLEDSGALVLITWEGVLAEAAKGAEAAGIGTIFAVGHAAGSPGAPRASPRGPSSPTSSCT